jgi:hypothetical protein
MSELLKGLETVPRDEADALLRELIGIVPLLGDLFMLAEALRAFSEGRTLVGLIYLANALPGPTLPLTHFLVMLMERKGVGK